jgi:hypothetical protein
MVRDVNNISLRKNTRSGTDGHARPGESYSDVILRQVEMRRDNGGSGCGGA